MAVEIYVENVDNFLQNFQEKNYVNKKTAYFSGFSENREMRKGLNRQVFFMRIIVEAGRKICNRFVNYTKCNFCRGGRRALDEKQGL